ARLAKFDWYERVALLRRKCAICAFGGRAGRPVEVQKYHHKSNGAGFCGNELIWRFSTKSMSSYKSTWPSLCRNRGARESRNCPEKMKWDAFSTPPGTAVGGAMETRERGYYVGGIKRPASSFRFIYQANLVKDVAYFLR